MKKIALIALIMIVLFSFSACKTTVGNMTSKDKIIQGDNHTIFKISEEKEVYAQDSDTLLLTVKFSYPEIENKKNSKTIEKVNATLKDFVEQNLWEFEEDYLASAKDEYVYSKANKVDFISYFTGVDYEIFYDKKDILSLVFTVERYAGGAHPNYTKTAFNFDMLTGEKLKLSDVLDMTEQKANKMISETFYTVVFEEKDLYFDEALEYISSDKFRPEFYITEDSIQFFTQLYEIAPFAAGFPQIGISFDESKSILKDRFK